LEIAQSYLCQHGLDLRMDSLIKDFILESTENLDRLDQEFVQLETDPKNSQLLDSIFRTIHTIKGSCGFLGFTKLETLSHAGESLLSQMRAGELLLNQGIADVLLQMVDAIREILREIEVSDGTEGQQEYGELVESLKRLQMQTKKTPAPAAVLASTEQPKAGPPAEPPPPAPAPPAPAAKRSTSKPTVAAGKLGGKLVRQGRVTQDEIIRALQLQQDGDGRRLGEILISLGLVTERDIEEVLNDKPHAGRQEGTIRVDVSLLESQMNLVSELVLLRNRLLQKSSQTHDRELETAVHGLNVVTSDLRKNVMKARMQPVSQLYEKLPRLVRDISRDLGKSIQLETAGGDTELDKTLLEAIKDPVTHIIRNSVDHGVELPAQRAAAGKPEAGVIRVRAFHEGGNFHLEVADDGAGIDVSRVKEKAIARGLITAAQAQKMSEAELQALVFAAGLSTAEKVTSVSGRGVGMDVVKTNIEKIGGRVKVESAPGAGTRVHLEIPLTLATISALTVLSSGSVFAIPQSALVEMLSFDSDESRERTQELDGVRILRFRGAVLPLLSLRTELKLPAEEAVDSGFTRLVVVQAEGRRFAIEVDIIRHNEEIVIKPLAKYFKQIGLFTGAATLGDGSVALILDLASFARRSGMTLLEDKHDNKNQQTAARTRRTIVLVSASHGERLAIPVECVERLESLSESTREQSGGLEVMQYRGEILRVARLEDLLGDRRSAHRGAAEPPLEPGKFAAVVTRGKAGAPVIFEVSRILGIVNLEIEKLTPPTRPGVEGSMVIQDKVAEILQMEILMARVAAGDFQPAQLASTEMGSADGR
jgi:two-component system chemotaxis sensor kinase CheA